MSREWKPGALAHGTIDNYTGLFVYDGELKGWNEVTGSEEGRDGAYIIDLHPVVVIDPENREQVERLVSVFLVERTRGERDAIVGGTTDAMQAALREFADPKPPKPEEPTGLGAVVEDDKGERWTRWGRTNHGGHWTRQVGNASTTRTWDHIAAVKVLSEGVQP